MPALTTTDLPGLGTPRRGKVRDLYDARLADGSEALLIVASDRISAFDVVMANGVPGKGIVLTQISRFWFEYFEDQVEHHLISTEPEDVERPANFAGRLLDRGTFALQAHDPGSEVHFKQLQVRPLGR